jgi:hypothetical protein
MIGVTGFFARILNKEQVLIQRMTIKMVMPFLLQNRGRLRYKSNTIPDR